MDQITPIFGIFSVLFLILYVKERMEAMRLRDEKMYYAKGWEEAARELSQYRGWAARRGDTNGEVESRFH